MSLAEKQMLFSEAHPSHFHKNKRFFTNFCGIKIEIEINN